MMFTVVPARMLRGAEFYNDPFAPGNTIGGDNSKAWFYNNAEAPQNVSGNMDPKAYFYNAPASTRGPVAIM
eukprot:CAMPEP_0206254684 /NCGR_PEP_ID=MMETSP0047_2-20121206/23829_1 /ASSEMBLY_ACC=CAM_ASM_000192 /TAXON_ID=195065 /ORGANISM="Chroomonas mesostigmatica_cf, Strain CCMP1168" /LENGTH=70 /DNA_ID=CAMNT_0053681001 /DNA_START=21 /DNA_END=233 /DNA_ORIENTATION=-